MKTKTIMIELKFIFRINLQIFQLLFAARDIVELHSEKLLGFNRENIFYIKPWDLLCSLNNFF